MDAPVQHLIDELDRVREAVAADDWQRAQTLLDDHDARLRRIFEGPSDQADLYRLLDAQRTLMSELAGAREAVGARLHALRQGSHAVRAYRQDAIE